MKVSILLQWILPYYLLCVKGTHFSNAFSCIRIGDSQRTNLNNVRFVQVKLTGFLI